MFVADEVRTASTTTAPVSRLIQLERPVWLDVPAGTVDSREADIERAMSTQPTQRDLDKAMWEAAGSGKMSEVLTLKGKGANPQWFNPWEPPGRGMQFNALHMAAGAGHADIVKYLVETCKVDLTARCDYGPSALEYAEGRDRGSTGKEAVVCFLKRSTVAHYDVLRIQFEAEEMKRLEEKKKAKDNEEAAAKKRAARKEAQLAGDAYPVTTDNK